MTQAGTTHPALEGFDEFLARQRARLRGRLAACEHRMRDRIGDERQPDIEIRKQPGTLFTISTPHIDASGDGGYSPSDRTAARKIR